MENAKTKPRSPLRAAIVAMTLDHNMTKSKSLWHENVIGVNGNLPWHYPEDLQHFKQKTSGKVVVMGRITWESLGCRALPNRDNVVISRSEVEGVDHYDSVEKAFQSYAKREIWVIGGAQIYRLALPYLHKLYVTYIPKVVTAPNPVKFPAIDPGHWTGGNRHYRIEGKHNLHYVIFRRINPA